MVAQWRGPEDRRKIGTEQRENDIEICLCAGGLVLLPGTRQGGPLGVLRAGRAVAEGRVWGARFWTNACAQQATQSWLKPLHIGCAANDIPRDRNSLASA